MRTKSTMGAGYHISEAGRAQEVLACEVLSQCLDGALNPAGREALTSQAFEADGRLALR
jgi:hypothetical protein